MTDLGIGFGGASGHIKDLDVEEGGVADAAVPDGEAGVADGHNEGRIVG